MQTFKDTAREYNVTDEFITKVRKHFAEEHVIECDDMMPFCSGMLCDHCPLQITKNTPWVQACLQATPTYNIKDVK